MPTFACVAGVYRVEEGREFFVRIPPPPLHACYASYSHMHNGLFEAPQLWCKVKQEW